MVCLLIGKLLGYLILIVVWNKDMINLFYFLIFLDLF